MVERSSPVTVEAWPPLKKALWNVLMYENLNDGHYIKAFDLIEKLYDAAILSGDGAATAREPSGWLHHIKEPNGSEWKMYSASQDNPWSHWVEEHKDGCTYTRTPLYVDAAQLPANRHTIIETAILSYCRRQSGAAVQGGRIYYAGLSIADLVTDIEAALAMTSTHQPCPGCDGHDCDDGCAYPGVVTRPERK